MAKKKKNTKPPSIDERFKSLERLRKLEEGEKPKRRKRKPFEPYITMEAKGGGKVEYKMGGGKVMGYKKGGKVIKTNMSGDDVVRGCYD